MEITWEKIKKKILQLKISKAPGPDGLHPRLLKELAQQISQPLETIFQLSLKEGKVPTDWKQGEITAIHKKGSRRTAGNYRPVSLTCILCKIMESLVREPIIDHMCENSLFSKYQYGFINRRSTTLQLLFVLDEWREILDQGGTIDAVYLDFIKAFDKVPHECLLHKLSAYGISDDLHNWIRSFLTGRTQRVKVDSVASQWRTVTSGIPQGSVLGPILFIICINDMPDALKNASTAAMFTDNTKLYRRTDTPNGPTELQEDLDRIFYWSDTWLMKFQPTKCKVLSMGHRQEQELPNLYLYSRKENGSLEKLQLELTEVEKDIGVYVDQKLSFQEQIINKTNKANSTMGIIRRTFDHIDHKNVPPIIQKPCPTLLRSIQLSLGSLQKAGHRAARGSPKESYQANPWVRPDAIRGEIVPTWPTHPHIQETKREHDWNLQNPVWQGSRTQTTQGYICYQGPLQEDLQKGK